MDPTLKDALTQLLGSRAVLILGQIAVGFGLMYLIDKFFKFVEEKLTDDTKLEIAVWLLGVKVGQKVESWPETFATIFNSVFGARHWSLKCFTRSALASGCIALAGFLLDVHWTPPNSLQLTFTSMVIVSLRLDRFVISLPDHSVKTDGVVAAALTMLVLAANVLPDFISLLETRVVLNLMKRSSDQRQHVFLLFVDSIITVGTAVMWNYVLLRSLDFVDRDAWRGLLGFGADSRVSLWLTYPALFTSIWLWLYAGSGFLLKAARRFEIGFGWFNRHFDIEKKPLQSIGLVAGALVAVSYWSAVIVSRVVK